MPTVDNTIVYTTFGWERKAHVKCPYYNTNKETIWNTTAYFLCGEGQGGWLGLSGGGHWRGKEDTCNGVNNKKNNNKNKPRS